MEYLEKNMSQVENGQLKLTNINKSFGSVRALNDVSIFTEPGKIHCLLGDNGAGKSTLVNIISGVLTADSGEYLVNGEKVNFSNPKQALNAGISTVYQNLAIIPMLSIYRNFYLGNEPIKNNYFKFMDKDLAISTTKQELTKFGVTVNDVKRPAGTLSGGKDSVLRLQERFILVQKFSFLMNPHLLWG